MVEWRSGKVAGEREEEERALRSLEKPRFTVVFISAEISFPRVMLRPGPSSILLFVVYVLPLPLPAYSRASREDICGEKGEQYIHYG